MMVYPFEYTLSQNATSGIYSIRAYFTEDQKTKPGIVRWFNIGGGD
jgi:hypothetical protein